MKLISIWFLLIPQLAFAIEGRLSLGTVKSNNNDGKVFKALVSAKRQNTSVVLGHENVTRIFSGQGTLSDKNYGLDLAHKFNESSYLELAATVSPDAVFFPKSSYGIAPHYIYDSIDFWAGARFSDYENSDITQLRAGALKEFSENLLLGAQIFSANSSPNATSAHLFGSKRLYDISLRADYSKGRTVEDDDLVGDFEQISLEAFYHVGPSFALGPKIRRYWGSVRDEDYLGIEVIIKE